MPKIKITLSVNEVSGKVARKLIDLKKVLETVLPKNGIDFDVINQVRTEKQMSVLGELTCDPEFIIIKMAENEVRDNFINEGLTEDDAIRLKLDRNVHCDLDILNYKESVNKLSIINRRAEEMIKELDAVI